VANAGQHWFINAPVAKNPFSRRRVNSAHNAASGLLANKFGSARGAVFQFVGANLAITVGNAITDYNSFARGAVGRILL
jgi:hypothetical protein